MTKVNTKSKQGFTIIEVVLVLAIAGLIFLMVFIAWPALQRSQRDTQRRNDYSMLSTAISNYATNNNGKLSNIVVTTGSGAHKLDASKYINENGEDPDGYPYNLMAYFCKDTISGGGTDFCGVPDPEPQEVYVIINADCSGTVDGKSVPAENKSSRAFAVYGYLEGGTQTFCSASQ
ncbi:type II secretion system protein [Candidatus Saccharibacteria bacterium]|nr:type II secretion system protein [Candidatus Saccharibacteria bacterium]